MISADIATSSVHVHADIDRIFKADQTLVRPTSSVDLAISELTLSIILSQKLSGQGREIRTENQDAKEFKCERLSLGNVDECRWFYAY